MRKIRKNKAFGELKYALIFTSLAYAVFMFSYLIQNIVINEGTFVKSVEANTINKEYEESYKKNRVIMSGTVPTVLKSKVPEKFLVEIEYEYNGSILRGKLDSEPLYNKVDVGEKVLIDIYKQESGDIFLKYDSLKNQ